MKLIKDMLSMLGLAVAGAALVALGFWCVLCVLAVLSVIPYLLWNYVITASFHAPPATFTQIMVIVFVAISVSRLLSRKG